MRDSSRGDGTNVSSSSPSGLLRVQGTSKLAFGATTAALVTLASGGTAVLVAHGTSRSTSATSLPQGAWAVDAGTAPATVVVDRVAGTFGAQPVLADPTEQALRDALGQRPEPGRRTLTVPLVPIVGGGGGAVQGPTIELPDVPALPGVPPVIGPPAVSPPVVTPPVVGPPVVKPPVVKPPVIVVPPPVHVPRVPLPVVPPVVQPAPSTPSEDDDRDSADGKDRDDDDRTGRMHRKDRKDDNRKHAKQGKVADSDDGRDSDKAEARRTDREPRGKHAKPGRRSR